MTKVTFVAAAVASMVAGAAAAQNTAFTNETRAADAVKAVETSITDAAKRDTFVFGNSGRKMGWTGSVSARATASTGNSESANVGLGSRLNYFDGVNGHRITTAYSYAKTGDTVTKDELLFGYDYTREFGSNLYGFGKLTAAYDQFDSYKVDSFLGFGLGYRVINNDRVQWSVQGGPGYRYAENADGTVAIREGAAAVSSYYSNQLTDAVALYNDTDVLWSKENYAVTNELGMSVSMTDALALRTSLTTQYNDKPATGKKHTDNTLGVSVVYSFN